VGGDCLVHPDGHPLRADLIVWTGREVPDAIEPSPYPLETPLPDVMVQELTAHAVLARLIDREVAALLIGVSLETANVGTITVMHKSSIT
jgi:hypothetical protein